MKLATTIALISIFVLGLAACGTPDAGGGRKVDASGKEDIDLNAVPAEVIAAARAAEGIMAERADPALRSIAA